MKRKFQLVNINTNKVLKETYTRKELEFYKQDYEQNFEMKNLIIKEITIDK